MKIMITFLSLLIIIAGILPFFGAKIPFPTKGVGYSVILIVLAVLIIALSLMNNLLMGFEKFVVVLQGLFIILIACLVFFPLFLKFLPRDGWLYSTMVIIVGALGFLYGFTGMG